MAVSEETHASVGQALRILSVEPFVVPVADHRLTGDALRAALDRADAPDWLPTLFTMLLLRSTGVDRADPAGIGPGAERLSPEHQRHVRVEVRRLAVRRDA